MRLLLAQIMYFLHFIRPFIALRFLNFSEIVWYFDHYRHIHQLTFGKMSSNFFSQVMCLAQQNLK
jgi:hypothetical protein